MMEIVTTPVAFVRGMRGEPEDDCWGGEEARIELVPAFGPEALQGLDDFSHVEVLFSFHAVDRARIVTGARHPRNNPAWPKVGIFAQRGKNRPNLLGSTICRLLRVDGTALVVAELDAIDGTPVLDLKPVMQEFLPRGALRQPSWSRELMRDYWAPSKRGCAPSRGDGVPANRTIVRAGQQDQHVTDRAPGGENMRKILLALAATIAFGCTPERTAQTPPVTSSARATAPDPTMHLIGVAGPFTGRYSAFGGQLLEGANAAVADINRAGGVLGKPLRAQSVDDACDPGTREDFGPSVRRAVAAARDLVAQGAVLVDGHFCSSSSIVASEVYAGSQAVMISPSSTNYRLTTDAAAKGWRHVFRTAPNDERQGDFAAAWLIRHYRGQRVAIVHDDSSYGQRIAAAAQRRLQATDMRIVVMEQIRQSSGGSDALVARLVAEGASSVFFAGYTEDAAKLVRQLREAKWGGAFIGTDALVDAEFWRLAGAAGQGTYATFLADPRRHPRAQSVVAQFKARGVNPEGYILFSYAAVQVWAEAARRAGTVDRDRVAAALRGGSFETVLGTLTFDATGDIVDPPYTLYMWNRGEYSEAPTR